MSKKATTTTIPETFEIRGELAEILRGMEGTNWSTNISKNNVKTVTVTFKVRQPMVTVTVK